MTLKRLLSLLSFAFLLGAAEVAAPRIAFKKGVPSFVTGLTVTLPADDTAVTRWLTRDFLPTYLPRTAAKPTLVRQVGHGDHRLFRYSYAVNGVPVEGAFTTVALRDGAVYRVTNSLGVIPSIDTTPVLSTADAARVAFTAQTGRSILSAPRHWAEKRIVRHHGSWRLAWKVRLTPVSLADGRFYYIDARDGALLGGGNDTRFAEPTDMAKVFETNPKRNKTPIEVELPWIDPTDGKLTSAPDGEGVRAIVAANCIDEGKTVEVTGYGTLAICTTTQIADKNVNGNFTYEDWDDGVAMKFDADDIYPEVSMYYHASKIYKFLRDLELDGFHYLSGHNAGSANPSPLIVVANFQMPQQGGGLAPMDNAFFSPVQPGFTDIFFADFPYQGDMLVFGQGTKTDFAYDGDVIYHEFGHAVEMATSGLSPTPYPDKYGFSNVPISINEGIADSFSFIMSQDACLGEYASEGLAALAGYEKGEDGFYCMRRADNGRLVNEDFTGESHEDGLPFVGMNWALYQEGLKNDLTREDFARLFIRMLLSFADPEASPQDYADIMLSEVENDPKFAPLKDAVAALIEERGFNEKVRARDITRPVTYIMSGGTSTAYGAPTSSFTADVSGDEMKIAPAYVQFYFDMPACMDTLTVTGRGVSTSQSGGTAPRYWLFVRKDEPVTYTIDDYPVVVALDTVVEPVDNIYELKNLEAGARYYLHFVNVASSEGVVAYISANATRSSADQCVENPDDVVPDDETTDELADADTVIVPDEADTKKGSSGGCSLILF